VLKYSEFGSTFNYVAWLFLFIFFCKGEPIELCSYKLDCIYARNFSAQFMNWQASAMFVAANLAIEKSSGIEENFKRQYFIRNSLLDNTTLKYESASVHQISDLGTFARQFVTWLKINLDLQVLGGMSPL
jgi:hypothetical protein